jgi:hypothetical protein
VCGRTTETAVRTSRSVEAMTVLGLFLVYGVMGILALAFWLCVRRLVAVWEARDVMTRLRADRVDVHQTEMDLGVIPHE